MKRKLLVLSLMFVAIFSCKKDDGCDNYYAIDGLFIETVTPNYVNIFFQVSDKKGNGVDQLTEDDFDILENESKISPSESQLQIVDEELPYTLKTVIMLDKSQSIGQADLQKIKTAAIGLIGDVVDNQQFAIYTFASSVDLVQDFTSDVSTLTAAINSITLAPPGTSTNLYGAVIEGANRWDDIYTINRIEQGFMVVLTDGSDQANLRTLSQAESAIYDKRCYTIGLGNEIDEDALKSIGNAGYSQLANADELAAKFIEIQKQIESFAGSFYFLRYNSPKRGSNTNTLTVKLKENCNDNFDAEYTGQFSSTGFTDATPMVVVNGGGTTFSVVQGDTYTLTASTLLSTNTPSYSWTSSNPAISDYTVSGPNNETVMINSTGNTIGQSYTLTVTDNANSLTTTITVNITDVPQGLIESFDSYPSNTGIANFSLGGWTTDNSTTPYEGTACITSGSPGDNGSREMVVYLSNLPAGANLNISFAKKVSSESSYDDLTFYINGVSYDSWSGTAANWTLETYNYLIPSGGSTVELMFKYDKDGSVDSGQDRAWIDDLSVQF